MLTRDTTKVFSVSRTEILLGRKILAIEQPRFFFFSIFFFPRLLFSTFFAAQTTRIVYTQILTCEKHHARKRKRTERKIGAWEHTSEVQGGGEEKCCSARHNTVHIRRKRTRRKLADVVFFFVCDAVSFSSVPSLQFYISNRHYQCLFILGKIPPAVSVERQIGIGIYARRRQLGRSRRAFAKQGRRRGKNSSRINRYRFSCCCCCCSRCYFNKQHTSTCADLFADQVPLIGACDSST